ncbi:cell division regulator GpsB [Fructilactobacillus florum]|nr:cell division regulator GpsB [Fructilactobacillus florum]
MANINFTPKDILQKEFKQKMRGYDPTDVDSFLDQVIKDYESFQNTIQSQDQQIQQLTTETQQLTEQLQAKPTVQPQAAPQPSYQEAPLGNNGTATVSYGNADETNVTNMDILKRLSNLERRVFGENN